MRFDLSRTASQRRGTGATNTILASADSINMGRMFAGRSIADSISYNPKLSDSVNQELMKQIMAENNTNKLEETQNSEPDVGDSVNNIFAGASSQSGIILGGVDMNKHGSSVSGLENPLNYAGHLCTLVNNQKEEHK